MFIVPKYLVNADGSSGARNPVSVVGVEHKPDIHASPTCVMQFDDAEGYLIGRAGKGLAYMFTMMKHARLGVGIEGHAVAERAYQNALAYAQERVQSRELGSDSQEPVRASSTTPRAPHAAGAKSHIGRPACALYAGCFCD